MMKNLQKKSSIRPEIIEVDAWTARKTSEVSIHNEKPTKEKPDKTRSYPSGLGQNTKKKEMTLIKEREEREEEETW